MWLVPEKAVGWPEPGYIGRQRTGPTSSTSGEKEDGSTLEIDIFFLNTKD